jgi:hypothetical protein
MGKAADTGNLADMPSPGAAALMEALAGFSGAHDAPLTSAEPITAHARGQTGTSSKTVAQVLGEITWLMTQSPRHKAVPLGDLEWLVMPALLLRQFRIFSCRESRKSAVAAVTVGFARRRGPLSDVRGRRLVARPALARRRGDSTCGL